MVWFSILIGSALLLFGRRLFWFFVGAVGFAVGVSFAVRFLHGHSEWVVLAVGIASGIIASLLAVFLQRMAIFASGFLAGAFILVNLLHLANVQPGHLTWLVLIIGGICGAVFISTAFEWAVIFLSSFTGSLVIVQSLDLQSAATAIGFVGLILTGVLVQNQSLKKDRLHRQN